MVPSVVPLLLVLVHVQLRAMSNSLHLPFGMLIGDTVRPGYSHLQAGPCNAGQFDSKLPSCALESSCIQNCVHLLACLLFCCCIYVS